MGKNFPNFPQTRCGKIRTPWNTMFFGRLRHPKKDLDPFSRFCTVKPSWAAWQTDWQTNGQTPRSPVTIVCISCIWCCLKIRTVQKSQRYYISCIRGEPQPNRLALKFREVITCAKLQNKILRSCDFTVGRNFDFLIDIWTAIATVHSYAVQSKGSRGTTPPTTMKLSCKFLHLSFFNSINIVINLNSKPQV